VLKSPRSSRLAGGPDDSMAAPSHGLPMLLTFASSAGILPFRIAVLPCSFGQILTSSLHPKSRDRNTAPIHFSDLGSSCAWLEPF
jgi:hypothetical protein